MSMLDISEFTRATIDSPTLSSPGRSGVGIRPSVRSIERVAEAAALLAILAGSAALELVGLQDEAFGNTYYAAAVKSMLASWHNFFFVASDLGAFVAVDKPPLGLWIQVLSAKLLGFNGVALLLPQALAGIASVGLLYVIVRRTFGRSAGLIAAAALAVMPISVVTARNNTMDATLVFTLLFAAWIVSVAAESGRLRLLLAAAAVVGLGFNIKMLQAYLVVPGFMLAYAGFAPIGWRRKTAHLGAALVVLLGVSLAWCVAVDLTPAGTRPYVGSSGTNSAIALALTYNGLGRVTQVLAPWLAAVHISVPLDLANVPGIAPGIGDPGFGRLFAPTLAGQASWLLVPAIVGGVCTMAALFAASRARLPRVRQHSIALTIWGGWLLSCGAYFSFARFYHTYYLSLLGPAIAALVGIGVATLWRSYARGDVLGWGLPIVLTGNGVLQVYFTSASSLWRTRLESWVLALSIGASLALVGARLMRTNIVWPSAAISFALAAMLIAPTAWSVTSVQSGAGGAWLPSAGPGGSPGGPRGFDGGGPNGGGVGGRPNGGRGGQNGGGLNSGGFGGGGGPNGAGSMAMTFAGPNWDSLDPNLVRYLQTNQGAATYVAATATSSYASVLTLLTDQPVMALGGYQGWDRILDPTQLASIARQGSVRFFLLSGNTRGRPPGGNSQDATSDLTGWVQSSCAVVPASTWQGQSGSLQLYDCAAEQT